MLAMQYIFELPSDFDMSTIRNRVREKGGAFDDFPDLAHKAFMCTELANGGPRAANRYATFYVWEKAEGATNFLTGPFFKAVAAAFTSDGRPVVQTWFPLHYERVSDAKACRWALQIERPVPAGVDLIELMADPVGVGGLSAAPRGLVSRFLGINIAKWTLVDFALVSEKPDAPADGLVLESLHVSVPGHPAA